MALRVTQMAMTVAFDDAADVPFPGSPAQARNYAHAILTRTMGAARADMMQVTRIELPMTDSGGFSVVIHAYQLSPST
jgi:hypothetical protein